MDSREIEVYADHAMSVTFTNEFDCADAIIARVGKQLRVATPLAAGKPVPILNALYRRAKEDPGIKLEIYTALTLAKPRGKSLLERRFLEPYLRRMGLEAPKTLEERFYARLLRAELITTKLAGNSAE